MSERQIDRQTVSHKTKRNNQTNIQSKQKTGTYKHFYIADKLPVPADTCEQTFVHANKSKNEHVE